MIDVPLGKPVSAIDPAFHTAVHWGPTSYGTFKVVPDRNREGKVGVEIYLHQAGVSEFTAAQWTYDVAAKELSEYQAPILDEAHALDIMKSSKLDLDRIAQLVVDSYQKETRHLY